MIQEQNKELEKDKAVQMADQRAPDVPQPQTEGIVPNIDVTNAEQNVKPKQNVSHQQVEVTDPSKIQEEKGEQVEKQKFQETNKEQNNLKGPQIEEGKQEKAEDKESKQEELKQPQKIDQKQQQSTEKVEEKPEEASAFADKMREQKMKDEKQPEEASSIGQLPEAKIQQVVKIEGKDFPLEQQTKEQKYISEPVDQHQQVEMSQKGENQGEQQKEEPHIPQTQYNQQVHLDPKVQITESAKPQTQQIQEPIIEEDKEPIEIVTQSVKQVPSQSQPSKQIQSKQQQEPQKGQNEPESEVKENPHEVEQQREEEEQIKGGEYAREGQKQKEEVQAKQQQQAGQPVEDIKQVSAQKILQEQETKPSQIQQMPKQQENVTDQIIDLKVEQNSEKENKQQIEIHQEQPISSHRLILAEPQRIWMDSENVETISEGNHQKPVVEFAQYVPTEPAEQQQPQVSEENEVNKGQNMETIQPQLQEEQPSRADEEKIVKDQKQKQGQIHQQQECKNPQSEQIIVAKVPEFTHKEAYEYIHKEYPEPMYKEEVHTPVKNVAEPSSPKKYSGRIARKFVHQKKVHQIVQDLQKHDEKRGPLHVLTTAKKSKKTDLSKLDQHISLDSNVLNFSIGELTAPENQVCEAEQQLDHLKHKLEELQRKKQEREAFEAEQDMEVAVGTIANFKSKKNFTGRIVKRANPNDSRLFDSSRVQPQGVMVSRGRAASSRGFQTGKYFTGQQEAQSNRGIHFRVRRPSRSYLGQSETSNLELKESQEAVEKADECFQTTRREDFQILEPLLLRPHQRELQFEPNFRERTDRFFTDLGKQTPASDYSQQELAQFAKKTFKRFGVNLRGQRSATLSVKKYRNCVSFILDSEKTIIWYYQGKFYYGGWKINYSGEGVKVGWGYEYQPGKYVYSGQFKDNRKEGYGIIKYLGKPNDVIYEGEWAHGFKQGIGKQLQADGAQYIGSWVQGKRHGYGTLKITQSEHYTGQFIAGIKNGTGTEVFKNGDMYVGPYKNGKFHGKGIYTWANHSRYEGQFLEGAREGYGVWVANHLDSHTDRYEGSYKHDKKNGFGKYYWKDNTTYEGYFLDDLKHGQGIVSYGDGRTARLQWFEGAVVPRPKDKGNVGSAVRRAPSRTATQASAKKDRLANSKHKTQSKTRGIRPSQGVQKL